MANIGGFATAASDLGGAINDFFGSQGSQAAANSYAEAASIAGQNAILEHQSTRLQEMQQQRELQQTLGAQRAEVAGAGGAESGSALDLLRSSSQQGALAKAMISEQGAIQELSYNEQAGLYEGLSQAASSTQTAQEIGGILNLAGAGASLYGALSGPSAATAGTAAGTAGTVGAASGSLVSLPGVGAAAGTFYAYNKLSNAGKDVVDVLQPFYNPVHTVETLGKDIGNAWKTITSWF